MLQLHSGPRHHCQSHLLHSDELMVTYRMLAFLYMFNYHLNGTTSSASAKAVKYIITIIKELANLFQKKKKCHKSFLIKFQETLYEVCEIGNSK